MECYIITWNVFIIKIENTPTISREFTNNKLFYVGTWVFLISIITEFNENNINLYSTAIISTVT